MSSRLIFCTYTGSLPGEEWLTSSSFPILLEFVWERCSNPDRTAPKWACLHIMVVFLSSPLVITLRALSMIWSQPWLGPFENRSWLVWPAAANPHYNVGSLGSGGWPPQTQGKGWQCPPVPSNSNNWPKGWISSASSSQNWEHTLETWAPESISVIVTYPSIITGASLECLTKCAIGSRLMKGTGVTSGCPLFWTAFSRVGFGSGSGMECWRSTAGCCPWGVELHYLSSPWSGLMIWLGWHISKPCGPNLDIRNTEVNWGPSCLRNYPDHFWVLGHFPDLHLWSQFCDQ